MKNWLNSLKNKERNIYSAFANSDLTEEQLRTKLILHCDRFLTTIDYFHKILRSSYVELFTCLILEGERLDYFLLVCNNSKHNYLRNILRKFNDSGQVSSSRLANEAIETISSSILENMNKQNFTNDEEKFRYIFRTVEKYFYIYFLKNCENIFNEIYSNDFNFHIVSMKVFYNSLQKWEEHKTSVFQTIDESGQILDVRETPEKYFFEEIISYLDGRVAKIEELNHSI